MIDFSLYGGVTFSAPIEKPVAQPARLDGFDSIPLVDLFKRPLEIVRKAGFEDAVIVGGALRDTLHGLCPKDIDVFVSPASGTLFGNLLGGDGWVAEVVESFSLEYCTGQNGLDVARVLTIDAGDQPPIQVVVLKEATSTLQKIMRVDFAICQVAWDGEQLHTTDAFWWDVHDRTFTITRCDSAEDHTRTLRRWERIRQRYPQHTLVDRTLYGERVANGEVEND